MTIVVVDLIPALLHREGRDRSGPFTMPPEGVEAVAHLAYHYRLFGITDADVPSVAIRRALDDAHCGEYFENLGSSADFGPRVNARVVRRVTGGSRNREPVVFVTSRTRLANEMVRARIGVVETTSEEFGGVPEAVASLLSTRVTP